MSALRRLADRWVSSLGLRALLPIVFLAFHLAMLSRLASDRFSLPFNSSPGVGPSFSDPAVEAVPAHWDRLIVSRWDAQHYITLGLRGYQYCAPRAALGPDHFPDTDVVCQLNFFPGYAFLGGALSRFFHLPVDYVLFGISLVASYFAMFLWTSKEVVAALGSVTTLLSLLLFNVFTQAFALVTVQTEPCALLLTMLAFVLLERRWYWAGALAAGAAGIVRPTGVATSAAYALALMWITLRERPTLRIFVGRLFASLLSGWGIIALFSFFHFRFGDAFVYAHARERYYHYLPDPLALFSPSYRWIAQSLWAAPNEGMWLAAGLLWFALGHRRALSRFSPGGEVYWYATYGLMVFIAAAGQVTIGFSGMSRYLFLAVPLFFAMAAAIRHHPAAIAVWIIISLAHYWSVSSCFYVGRGEPGFWEICHIQPGS